MDFKLEVKGLLETQKMMEQIVRDLHGTPMLQGMRDATLIVQRDAKIFSPVDTGRLRASITPEVRTGWNQVMGVVGSNVEYAPYMEKPGRVRGVGRRPFLEPALRENSARIAHLIGNTVGRIITRAGG